MTYNLKKELILPVIIRRKNQSNRFKITIINKIRHVLGINEVSTCPQPENFNPTLDRCFKCVEIIVWRQKDRTWTTSWRKICSKYQKFICKKHETELQYICGNCTELPNIVIDSFISIEVNNVKKKIWTNEYNWY